MFGIGIQELLVILLICLLVFGAGRLAEIGKGLGQGIREFKKAARDEDQPKSGDNEKKA